MPQQHSLPGSITHFLFFSPPLVSLKVASFSGIFFFFRGPVLMGSDRSGREGRPHVAAFVTDANSHGRSLPRRCEVRQEGEAPECCDMKHL